MDLSIIIVNWNSAGLLRKCLTSIYDNVRDVGFEVLVVERERRPIVQGAGRRPLEER